MNSTSRIAGKPSLNGIFSVHRSAVLLAVALAAVAALLPLLLPGPTQTQATPGIAVTPLKLTPVEGTAIMPTSGNPDKVIVEANNPPEFATGNAARSVPERVAAGDSDPEGAEVPVTDVIETLTAEDDAATTKEDTAVDIDVASNDTAPEGTTLTFTLRTTPSHGTAAFKPDAKGVITYTPKANYNGMDRFEYIATGDANGYDEATVTVTVTPVNDAPVVTGDATVSYAENGTAAVAIYTATDPDDDAITGGLTLSGADAGQFNISSAGALNFTNPPDFENPKDAGENNVYNVIISASDGTLSGTLAVTITVTDVNEGLVVTGDATVPVTDVIEVLTAEDDAATTKEDTAVDIDVASNDSAPDGTTLTFTLRTTPSHGTAAFKPGTTGIITYTPMTNYNGIDTFEYIATGDENSYDEATVTVTVTAVNDAPVVTGDATVEYAENGTVAVATYTATDPDGDTIAGGLTLSGADADQFNFSTGGALNFTNPPDFENPTDAGKNNVYELMVSASDGNSSGTLAAQVTVTDVIEGPVITGDATISYAENGTAAVATYSVTDPESDSVTWTLTGDDAEDFRVSSAGALTFRTAPDFEKPADKNADNVYNVIVSASDGTLSGTLAVQVTVTDVIEVLTAEDDAATTKEDMAVDIDVASNDSAPDGTTLTFTLRTTPSHGTAAFKPGTTGIITYTPMTNYNGIDTFEYIATGDENSYDEATVTVTVTAVNDAPVVTGDATISYAENGTAAVATYSVTDPESDSVTWSLTGDDAKDFRVSSAGALTFQMSPDFENPADAGTDNVYNVIVSASDGTLSGTLAVQVTVTDVIEVLTAADDAVTTKEDTAVDIDVASNDTAPDGTTLTFTLRTTPSHGTAAFKPDAKGVITYTPKANYNGRDTFEYIATGDENSYDEATVTVTVTPVNDAPVVTGDATVRYAENGAAAVATYTAADPESDSVTWSLTGDDAEDFSVNTDGALTFKMAPDFENPADAGRDNVYNVTVSASDGTLSGTLAVTITVTDLNDVLTAEDDAATTKEDTAVDIDVASNDTAPEGTTLTFTLRTTPSHGTAAFKPGTTGVITYTPMTNYNGIDTFKYIATGDENGYDEATVTVTVTPVNDAPVVTGDATISYAENGAAAVGIYTATDPESDSVMWSLTGDDAEDFSIGTGGALTFQMSPDFETPADAGRDNVYNVIVSASDGNSSGTLAVQVTVTNANEGPVVTGDATVSYAENGTAAVATYSATDPENDRVTWSLTGADAEDFTVSSDGALTFQRAPDFETPADEGENNVYNVVVTATDSGGLSDSITVNITVTDVNEAPTVSGSTAVRYAENGTAAVATYTATDPESDSVMWSLTGDDAEDFSVNTDGALTFKIAPDFENPADAGRDNVYNVTVSASDGTLSGTLAVTITVTDVNDVLTAEDDAATTKEDTAVDIDVASNDTAPEGTTLTFTLRTTPSHGTAAFKPDATGVITYMPMTNYNGIDTFKYIATGDENGYDEATVTVTPVNDEPVVTGDATVEYAENGAAAVAIYAATDPESDSVTWTLTGDDAEDFNISSAGALTFQRAPDFETPADAGENNVYNVVVTASDGNSSGTLAVQVTVTNVNEAPTVTGDAIVEYAENGTAAVATYTATDPENDSVTWTLTGDDAEDFSVNTDGALTFQTSPDFENPADKNADNVYDLIVSASDGNSSGTLAVQVMVTNVNEAPTITGDATIRYAENGTAAVATYTAADPEGATVTWSLTGDDAEDFSVNTDGALTFQTPPDFENPADAGRDNVYNVTVSASDGNSSGTLAVTITVTDLNDVLTAEDDDATTDEDTAVDIDVASNDIAPDGATLTFTLRTTPSHGTAAFKPGTTGVITYMPMTNYNGIDTFEYIATGDENSYDEATVTVTVTAVNDAPVVTGDATVRYAENGAAAVATYTATDPESDSVTWSLTGADAEDFTVSSDGALTFQRAPDFETPADEGENNVYNVVVTATDSGGLSDSITVNITVTDVNEAPTVSGSTAVRYAENGAAVVAAYTATDPENDSVTWSLTGADAEDFSISSAGALDFLNPPDFENPMDNNTDNVYDLIVSASDGTLSGTLAVQVTVTNVNEGPVVTGDATVEYAENGTAAIATYTATDPEGATVTWSLTGADAEDFRVSSAGVLTFRTAPDFETPADENTDNVYDVTVSASDRSLSGTLAVQVTVTDVNEVLTVTGDATVEYDENGTAAIATYTATDPEGATVTWSLTGDDAEDFRVSSTGALTFQAAPDFENPADKNADNVYDVVVSASDGTLSGTLAVQVTVTDVDEAPTVTGDATVSYAENGAAAVAAYTVTDTENDSVTWSLTGDDAEDFSISSAGVLTFRTPPDFETPADAGKNNVYNVIVSASNGTLSGTLAVQVTVTNANEGPVVTGDATVEYAENGAAAVATYSATDPESDSVTWTLTGDDAEDFSISSAGVLTFQTPPDFENPTDAGGDNFYNVTVLASDGNSSGTLAVQVTVTNVNDAPVVTGDAIVSYAENGTAAVVTYTATDPEGDSVTWTLTGDDAEDFRVSSTGALTFQAAPDFEKPADKNADNVYNVIVSASDGTLSGTLAVTITVTDVIEVLTAADDAVTTKEDTAVDIDVASNDIAPDGATLTFTLRTTPSHGTAAFKPDAKGVITYMPKANYNGMDRFEYIATGDENSYDEGMVTVTVTPVNDAPVVTGDATISYAENGTVAVVTYTATDPDGDVITGGLTLSGADADQFNFSSGALTFQTSPDFENPTDAGENNVYNVVVTASDGSLSGTLAVQVTVTNVNEAPTVTGSAIVEYAENGTAAVATYTATDPDEGAITGDLTLSGADADQFHISTGGALNFTNPPDFENPTDVGRNNVYNVTVTATDSGGLSDSVIVTITVVDVTELPSAPATPSVAALTTTSLRVIWTAPANTGPTITSYDVQYRLSTSTAWTNTPMNVAATSTDITTGLTPNTAYHVRVRAINEEGDGNWSPHANVMTLAAAPTNNVPSFTETGPVDRNVAENAVPGAIVGKVVAANDSDVGDALTYSVLGSNDFTIDNTGQIKVASGASLDHEATSSYVVTVRVRDSKNPFGTADTAVDATITVNITVTDVDEPPTAATSGPTVMPMSRTDLTVTWTALSSAGVGCPPITGYDARYRLSTSTMWTAGPQNLNGTSTTLTGLTPNTAYQVQVRAKNHEGDGPWSVAGTGTTKANNAPVFNEGTTATRTVAENMALNTNVGAPVEATDANTGDTMTYSLGGTDASSFTFNDATRRIQTNDSLDCEAKSSYSVTVSVRDAYGGSDTITVTIKVTNVEEAGTVGLGLIQPRVGTPLTASLTDPDGSVSALTWAWVRLDTAAVTSGAAIADATSANYTPVADDVGKWLRVTAVYTDGEGPNKSASAVTDNAVKPPNSAPTFTDGAATTRTVPENSRAGANVGTEVAATDPDAGDTLTYTLGGADRSSFNIVPNTGEIMVASGTTLDHEAKSSYTVTVTATDNGSLTATITVTINVTNVDEAGTVSFSPAQSQVGTALTATMTDPDGSVSGLTWAWEWLDTAASTSGTPITDATSASYMLVADDVGKYLRATATYTDFYDGPKTASAVTAVVLAEQAKVTLVLSPSSISESGSGNSTTVTVMLDKVAAAPVTITVSAAAVSPATSADFTLSANKVLTIAVNATTSTGTVTITAVDNAVDAPDKTVTVSGTVSGGDAAAPANMTLTITDDDVAPPPPPPPVGPPPVVTPANAAPSFTETGPVTRNVAENTAANTNIGAPITAADTNAGDTMSYSLGGADAASFAMDEATGQMITSAALDYESGKASYSVTVSVHDGKNASGAADTTADATIAVTITVTNMDEAGTVALSEPEPQLGASLTAALTDPDGGVSGVVWSWERSADRTAWTTIGEAPSDAYTPSTADRGSYLRATAHYTDGQGSGKKAEGTTDAAVPSNIVPVFPDTDLDTDGLQNLATARAVAENTPASGDVGAPVITADPDGDTLTYTLSGPDASSFTIDENTGQIKVSAGTVLDYETDKNAYEIVVIATDPSGASFTIAVTIRVTNVDLSPYDRDHDDVISKGEAIAAVADYVKGLIGKDEAIGVVLLYFLGTW